MLCIYHFYIFHKTVCSVERNDVQVLIRHPGPGRQEPCILEGNYLSSFLVSGIRAMAAWAPISGPGTHMPRCFSSFLQMILKQRLEKKRKTTCWRKRSWHCFKICPFDVFLRILAPQRHFTPSEFLKGRASIPCHHPLVCSFIHSIKHLLCLHWALYTCQSSYRKRLK